MNWTAYTVEVGRKLFGIKWNPETATPREVEAIEDEIHYETEPEYDGDGYDAAEQFGDAYHAQYD